MILMKKPIYGLKDVATILASLTMLNTTTSIWRSRPNIRKELIIQMKTTSLTVINTCFGAIGAFLGWFLGGLDGFLYILLIFMVVDYITGVLCAVSEHKLSSEIGFRGLTRKVLILLLVGIAHCLDVYLLKNGSAIRTATIFFYISNEGISLLENTSRLGLPVPDKLKNVLQQLHNKDGDK
ncbi:Phage-related holin [Lactobacillus gasseri ATCC 33323 = JCM 1131]|uniref:Phage-related holin n=4 Tax=Lactobacillus TaxID=1578 RepID=A0A805Z0C3_LACGA|nr:Phage-related holin [Lactobacillus gasseri ATCC 33323 = JCM 1131]